ncbi:MAG TPA: TetR/AcrR family transcriptional regulator [Gemmatimonadaceae bacterium]|nr:TetR/AcrR family transcriptional regulator [Gemmatimonadaceae bacterium]
MDRRQEILAAAAGVFSQYGFLGATTRRIAEAAGVNEVTLFRYFGSKDTLLLEAMQHVTQASGIIELPAEPVDPVLELSAWSEAFISHLRLRSSMIRKTMSEIEEHPEIGICASHVPKRASADLCAYLDALKRKGLASEDFDSKTAAAMLMGAIFGDAMGRGMMGDIYPEPADKAASMYATFLLRAVGAAKGSRTRSDISKQGRESKQLST